MALHEYGWVTGPALDRPGFCGGLVIWWVVVWL